jgi:hypothetical protein
MTTTFSRSGGFSIHRGPGSAAGGIANMIVPPGTGRALAAPQPRSFAVPLPLRKKEVAEQRSQLKRHRQMTQLNRPALRKYWWATHLRQLRSTFAPTSKEANDN